jgi:Sec-independent protein secretion pathway component TatC
MTGIILMEFLFAFAMPVGFTPDGTHAGMITPETLASGFRWAYVGGAGLCFIALILSATMQDRKIGVPSVEGEATML